jgi:hypothetical protein
MNASWMSLLTSLTLGAGAGAVRAQLRAVDVHPAKQLRLVVQTYDPREGRALGAIQRAVTPRELEQGLAIDIPHMSAGEEPYVVAWVERGEPNLEHDGLDARPQKGSLVGFAHGDDVSIELRRS